VKVSSAKEGAAMGHEEVKELLRELRRIRLSLYLIVVLLAFIGISLALNFWAESTRPVKMSQQMRPSDATSVMRAPPKFPELDLPMRLG
jgi:hypothetical protein